MQSWTRHASGPGNAQDEPTDLEIWQRPLKGYLFVKASLSVPPAEQLHKRQSRHDSRKILLTKVADPKYSIPKF